jgi:5'-3' exoribonuclease 2
MVELEDYLQRNFVPNNLQMIFSSSAECGEGEHKILAHIRANRIASENVCIYGTDGDWLLLTLPLCGLDNRLSNIYLLKDHFESQYYIDIQLWRAIMQQQFAGGEPSVACMRDVLFLSFLFGNDFVPSLYCLSLRFRKDDLHAMRVLSIAYKAIGCSIVGDKSIDFDAFFKLLHELQKKENALIAEKVDMEQQYVRRILQQYRQCEPQKKAAFKQEFILPFRRTITNSSLQQPYIYRYHYYQHHLKSRSHLDWARIDLCHDYLLALDWNWHYYSGNLLDWHYSYPHTIAPFIDDLYRSYKTRPEPNWLPTNALTTDIQLLYIIPKSRLPRRLLALASSPQMAKYFPSKLRVASMDKIRVWECECDMLLPSMDDFIASYLQTIPKITQK